MPSSFTAKIMRSACWSTGTFWQNRPPQADTADRLSSASSTVQKNIADKRKRAIKATFLNALDEKDVSLNQNVPIIAWFENGVGSALANR